MDIIESTAVDPVEWAGLVAASDDVWLYHTHEWIESTAKILSLTNHYLIARENGHDIGGFSIQLFPALRLGRPRHVVYSTMMGPAGPFCVRGISEKQCSATWIKLTAAARAWAESQGAEMLHCSLPPLAPERLRDQRGVNPLVLCGWKDRSTHTLIAELTRDEGELLKRLSKGAKACIKNCRQKGFFVERADWRLMLNEYYKLHVQTYARTGATPHPKAYFELIARLGSERYAVLWVCRNPTGGPVAFHNCGRFGNNSLYWTGCSTAEGLKVGANHFLFWSALLGAKQDGCSFYEIGEAFPNARSGKLKGLTDFKRMFGGSLRRYYRGEIELRKPSLLRTYWRILKERLQERQTSSF
jgi:hypothetical protein